MLVHGVKGELLTRNRMFVLLAAARRECWSFFPHRLSLRYAPIGQRTLSRRPANRLRRWIESTCSRRCMRAAISFVAHVRGDVDRILSIERSASGAGKKAAYDALSRDGVDDLAVCCKATGRAVVSVVRSQ